ncbi:hypothetical protein ACH0CP_12685 [Sphingomonas sp. 179-I 2A4 NHS]|uniref:hypothetical protein n=1 Tax=unclassified Sphingomonas TaxID=196159 RepID=UPI003879CBBF
MLDLRIIAGTTALPIYDLPAALGREQAAKEIGDQIDALMAFYDDLAGDPDLEDGGDLEPDGSELGDQSWPEGTVGGFRISMQYGQFYEDAEDSDPREEDDHSGEGYPCEDSFEPISVESDRGPGCPLSDPGGGDPEGAF